MVRIGLIGDYTPAVTAHRAINAALALGGAQAVWIHTSEAGNGEALRRCDGLWCVPASPYASAAGAFTAIRYARETGRPFLGTCGGFQHAIIEYARNVLGIAGADHAETNPEAEVPLIAPLACSLVEVSQELTLAPGSLLARAYGGNRIAEEYHCRYGLHPALAGQLWESGELRPVAHDAGGEVRAVELSGHPFFIATLFQPERAALRGELPPLVRAFLGKASARPMLP